MARLDSLSTHTSRATPCHPPATPPHRRGNVYWGLRSNSGRPLPMPPCGFGPYLSFVGYYAGWSVSGATAISFIGCLLAAALGWIWLDAASWCGALAAAHARPLLTPLTPLRSARTWAGCSSRWRASPTTCTKRSGAALVAAERSCDFTPANIARAPVLIVVPHFECTLDPLIP